ncbi:MAG: hypothetical protein VX640_13935 [Pseudomonadota bacterium]|nr:hypothetical protein [Pseudomonadota bacterium]
MRNLPFIERSVRRSRVYGGRLLRSVGRQPLRYNCCFHHIPKSGGTSLSEALHAVVPLNRHIGEVPANTTRRAASIFYSGLDDEIAFYDDGDRGAEVFSLREKMLLAFMANDCALVHGHILFSQKADRHFGERYKYVTMLRDPVSRVISNYRAAQRAGYVCDEFSVYLNTRIGRAHATHNLRYFSGRAFVEEADAAAALIEAKAAIDRFAVIGFVDAMDDFVSRFEEVFGARLSIGRYNVGKSAPPEIAADERRRLEALCAADIELHEYAMAAMARGADKALAG